MMRNPFITIAMLALFLSGCSVFDKTPEKRLPGVREPALRSQLVQNDTPTQTETIILPAAYNNLAWPQAGGSANNANHHLALGEDVSLQWQIDINNSSDSHLKVLAQPIIVDGVLYALNNRYTLLAFDAKTGKALWREKLPVPPRDHDAFGGGIGYENGVIFITTGFAKIFAFDVESRTILWTNDLPAPARSSPAMNSRAVISITIDNQTTAFDINTGDIIWQHVGFNQSTTILGGAKPAINDVIVAVPYSSGEVFGLFPGNGRVMWADNLSQARALKPLDSIADILAFPIIDRQQVIALSNAGRLHAIDVTSGTRLWQITLRGTQTPWVAGDYLFAVDETHRLQAFDRDTGKTLWVANLPAQTTTQNSTFANIFKSAPKSLHWVGPLLGGDRLYVANQLGSVIEISPYTGAQLREFTLSGGILVPPLVADETLYFLTTEGKIEAYR